jgi:hypothetical protein
MNEYGVMADWYRQGKTENLGAKLVQCQFVHHKSHMD